ncbi:MAG: hypothetical protein AB8G17_14855 [Gammaproteobacteria bacterium]
MNAGSIAAIVVVVGYIGFEVYAVKRSGFRMEPGYILGQFASAARGAELCATPNADQQERFARNYATTRWRAERALAAQNPTHSTAQINTEISAQIAEYYATVDTLVETNGCAGGEAWKLVKHFDNLSRLNLPQPKS